MESWFVNTISRELCAHVHGIEIFVASSIRFPWHYHPQGRTRVFIYEWVRNLENFEPKISAQMIFSSQRFFSPSSNNCSEPVLRLLKPIFKPFYTSRRNFSKMACYSHRTSSFRSNFSIFWLFWSKFRKDIPIFEHKIHLISNFNTQWTLNP